RLEIESHVTHTYNFLRQIPWTPNLRWVPEIAYGHHEKLNGAGYPLKRRDPEISLQTRMMTIADIYDALTAWDRPYKKAIPPEKALDILHMEVKDGHVDPDLLQVFVQAKIFERIEELRALGAG
ncbi:MAG TPA: HD domain-containing phosphohydrolase, partial [Turneriella sp.]|nr:HD domain-containing phosphohydrolase [Turneriella sp.]